MNDPGQADRYAAMKAYRAQAIAAQRKMLKFHLAEVEALRQSLQEPNPESKAILLGMAIGAVLMLFAFCH